MSGAISRMLPDGKRLHLHHGPIDLIIEVTGNGREHAYDQASDRFDSILNELVSELALLRAQVKHISKPKTPVGRRMFNAAAPFASEFVTPMAAVAGAVADEIICVIKTLPQIEKAWVNNGGDAAFYLGDGQQIKAVLAPEFKGSITIKSTDRFRGIATSGWRGRSHSLGIADAVSVIATNAAQADVAATLIANAVDLPGHRKIKRVPANHLFPDSDLGNRLVTQGVERLNQREILSALARGTDKANEMLQNGLIAAAVLFLCNESAHTGKAELQLDHITG